jgi:acetyl-CoA synthetase/medium-chain acyl-CoA synthetase
VGAVLSGRVSREHFRLDVPERYNFAADVVDRWAEDREKLALVWVDDTGMQVRVTFDEMAERSRRAATALRSLGVGRGDVVLVLLPTLVEWWAVNLACLRMGAIACPGTVQLSPKDIAYRIEAAGPACVIADPEVALKVDEALGEVQATPRRVLVGGGRPGWVSYHATVREAAEDFEPVPTRSDQNAILYFTSGTTGAPKMVMHTHASYPLAHQITGRFWLGLGPDDLHWNLSDTGWAKAAWSSLFGPWHMGAAVFVHHAKRFEPQRALELLQEHPITSFCGAPTVYRMLLLEDLDRFEFPSLRSCVAAGEPLNPEILAAWKRATGITIRDGYGQTETTVLAGTFTDVEPRPGSMGVASPGFDVAVIDEDGRSLPPGERGDLAVRVSPDRPVGIFKAYWKNPEKTAGTYRGDWYVTGDRATRDSDGYFWFIARADDVIISSGYRIGPFEVESALLEHEAVAESAVVSSPDPVRGEVVKAFVVLRPGIEPDDHLILALQEHVKETTAPFKYPRLIEFVDTLPKTVSGKILRRELRDREWAAAPGRPQP